MRNSWLISLLWVVLLGGCRSYSQRFIPLETAAKPFTPAFLDTAHFEHSFRARIDAYGHTMGGIFIIKKLDTNHYRMALLNEFGGTLLGFELADGDFTLHHAIAPLRRKPVLDLLKRDFLLLLQDNAPVKQHYIHGDSLVYETVVADKRAYHYLRQPDSVLVKTVRAERGRERTTITYDYRDPDFPDITLSHRGGKLNIFLFLLQEVDSEPESSR